MHLDDHENLNVQTGSQNACRAVPQRGRGWSWREMESEWSFSVEAANEPSLIGGKSTLTSFSPALIRFPLSLTRRHSTMKFDFNADPVAARGTACLRGQQA